MVKIFLICSLIASIAIDVQAGLSGKSSSVNKKVIQKKIKREVERQVVSEKRNILKNMLYGAKGQEVKQPSLLYKLPHWPFYTQFYEQRDIFSVDVVANGASRASLSHGDSQDLAALALGQKCVVAQDVFLVSKLAQKNVITGENIAGDADLALFKAIANQPMIFDASTWELAALLNFGKHFKRGRLSFNVQLPLLMKQNKLELTNEYSDAVQEQVQAHTDSTFSTMSLHELFNTMLQDEDYSFSSRSTQSGLGDLVTSLYYEIPSKAFERSIVGLKLVLPTSPAPATNHVWSAQIGNGGFTQLGVFASLLHHKNRWVNLHLHGSLTGSFAAHQTLRVPTIFTNDGAPIGSGTNSLQEDIVFGSNFVPTNGGVYSESETIIRGLGLKPRRLHVTPGIEGFVQIGNMIERCFVQRGFLDVFYGVRVKAKDRIQAKCPNDLFDPTPLINKSDFVEHKIGGDWSYQFNNQTRLVFGSSYVFAGCNVPQVIEGHLNFNLEF